MNAFRLLPLSLALGAALALPAQAQSLVALYESARAFDASYQSVKSLFDATLAKSEQARAGLLHTIAMSANASLSTIDNTLAKTKQGFYDTQSATLSASKPLYRPANQITFNQSQRQIEVVEQQLLAADARDAGERGEQFHRLEIEGGPRAAVPELSEDVEDFAVGGGE